MGKRLRLFLSLILIIKAGAAYAEEAPCMGFYEGFFRENYNEVIQKLCPNEDSQRVFGILFDAYSIKFKTVDFEYLRAKEALLNEKNRECFHEIKKYIRNLNEIAIEEYDSFLDDLGFEICEDEHFENRIIKKEKKKYKKQLKKALAKCN